MFSKKKTISYFVRDDQTRGYDLERIFIRIMKNGLLALSLDEIRYVQI